MFDKFHTIEEPNKLKLSTMRNNFRAELKHYR